MLRIRATGGAVTPTQLLAIARLSQRYGANAVHLTSRQEFQIHDVALENAIPAIRGLPDAGFSTRGGGGNTVRNIIVSPDAGVAADEAFDPSPYAFALTSLLIVEPDSWTLPRKLQQLGEARFRELYLAEYDAASNDPAAIQLVPAELSEEAPTTLNRAIADADESIEYLAWKKRYVFEQRQAGRYSVLILVALGNIANNDLAKLAEFLSPLGGNTVRATFGQNLRLRNIPEASLPSVYQVAKTIGGLADLPRVLANSISCTGSDTCKLGICLPKGALNAVEMRLRAAHLDLDRLVSFQISFSGCPNSCGQHSLADLGFYGQAQRKGQRMYPAYGIVAGSIHFDGNALLAQQIDSISAHDLPEFTAEILAIWLEKQWRFQSFAEYIDAEGKDDIRAICDRYRKIPDFDVDRSYYIDWDSERLFTVAGRGLGECSAGLFDLVELDLKQIDAERRRLAGDISEEERADALYRIVLSSSRMLLVTRGVEAPTDDAVFSSFDRHFLATGLVEALHRPVVDAARQRNYAALRNNQKDVFALASAMRELYNAMDISLRLPTETHRVA